MARIVGDIRRASTVRPASVGSERLPLLRIADVEHVVELFAKPDEVFAPRLASAPLTG